METRPKVGFETPDNIRVEYETGQLGSRFIAWVYDMLVQLIALVILWAVALVLWIDRLTEIASPDDPANEVFVILGALYLIGAFMNVLYFFLFEWLGRGQTPGKRKQKLRVVGIDGIQPNVGALFLRNIFRILDHIPIVWIVPVVSSRAQRLGDMVSGTLVVGENPEAISSLRYQLEARQAAEAGYRFDSGRLARLGAEDYRKIEALLERVGGVEDDVRRRVLTQATQGLVGRLNVEPPARGDEQRFLEDLLSAEYRRRSRQLG